MLLALKAFVAVVVSAQWVCMTAVCKSSSLLMGSHMQAKSCAAARASWLLLKATCIACYDGPQQQHDFCFCLHIV